MVDEMTRIHGLVRAFGCVPPGVQVIQAAETIEGPGGAWTPALWFVGFNQIRAVVVPVEGNCPVAYSVVWADPNAALGCAVKFTLLAAGVSDGSA